MLALGRTMRFACIVLFIALFLIGCQPIATNGTDQAVETDAETDATVDTLTVYSGRNENLVGPLLEQYAAQSGVDVEVRYGGTAEMAAVILEEGQNSPADVFYGQDAGALGALAEAGRCVELPETITGQVDPRFVSPAGEWVGASGRARVLVYNTEELSAADLPESVFDLTADEWQGRIGWAPTNGSFQAFVTAMRVNEGEEATRQWLAEMVANDVQVYSANTPIVEAVGAGEVVAGLVNHYYLYRFLAEDPDFPADNYFFGGGDPGAMINVAGACAIDTGNQEAALAFIEYLLSDEAQQYFADETNEYPLTNADIEIDPRLQPLDEIDSPEFDLSDIDDLQGTLDLLQETGALQ